MPHLRRQPNPRDLPNQDPTQGNLRAQFHTPPARHTPSNLTHRLPPSTGPNVITPDALAQAGHPIQINPFTIFGRPGVAQPPPETMDDDEFDEDYDPRGMAQIGEDEPLDHDDSFEVEDGTEGQYDDSDINGEELEEEEEEVVQDHFDEEEDPDEEMHDRGTTTPPCLSYSCRLVPGFPGPNPPLYRKVPFSFTPEPA